MNINPIRISYNINRKQPTELIAVNHLEDSSTRVIELLLTDGAEKLDLSSAAASARIVTSDKILLSDNVPCTVTESTVSVPIDNAVIQSRKCDLFIEVSVRREGKVLTLPFPLWVRVNGSVLDDAQVSDHTVGTIPELLAEAEAALERAESLADEVLITNKEDKANKVGSVSSIVGAQEGTKYPSVAAMRQFLNDYYVDFQTHDDEINELDTAIGTKLSGADGAVTTAKLADGAVTTEKLGAKAVTGDKIANGTITGTKISTNAITTNQIVDLNVTAAKLGNGAVTTAKIDDGAVTTAKIGDGAVTSGKLEGSLSAIINAKEISANKVTSMSDTVGAQDDAHYPSVSAVRDWASSTFAAVEDMNDALDELDGQKADKSDTYTKTDVLQILATGKASYTYYVTKGQLNDNNDDVANTTSGKFMYLKTADSSDAAAQYLPTSDIDSIEVGAHDCTFTFRLFDASKTLLSKHSQAANTTYVPASNVAYIKINAYRANGITETQFRQWIAVNRKSKLLELERRIAALEGSASTNSVSNLSLNTVEDLQTGIDDLNTDELTVQPEEEQFEG